MTTLPQRVATRAAALLAGPRHDRRTFLRRAALVGTALAVNPWDFILRPGTAYASVCGPGTECTDGWSAFCCTINDGANTCPPGSYAAGWWKIGDSAFCRGEDRFIVDCNRLPEAQCACQCASGDCDRRRTCCNNFRYGQCNQQIPGITEVVCRVALCTPPWVWDPACTPTVRADERTRDHSSSCLPPPGASVIAITYADLGLTGSPLGAPTTEEADGPRGGRWQAYQNGAISYAQLYGPRVLLGEVGLRYATLGGPDAPLGYAVTDTAEAGDGRGVVATFEGGGIWSTPTTGGWEVRGPLRDHWLGIEGGPEGWLGYPTSGVEPAPGGRERSVFEAGWMLAFDPSTGEVRLFPADTVLPDQPGEWPPTVEVVRWDGVDRAVTAARVARETFPAGAETAFLARADDFADALVGGVWAGLEGAPLLLAGSETLPDATAAELERLSPERVVVLGGVRALGEAVTDAVADLLPGATVERVAGVDRYETAALISEALTGGSTVPTAFLATAGDFADALVAVPVAARSGGSILLTAPGELPAATGRELRRLRPREVVVLGGTSAVQEDVARAAGSAAGGAPVTRLAGDGRYETAAKVVRRVFDAAGTVFVATGEGFADGLAVGPAAVVTGSPLVLVSRDAIPDAIFGLLRVLSPRRIVIVGGEAAVSAAVVARLASLPVAEDEAQQRAQARRPGRGP